MYCNLLETVQLAAWHGLGLSSLSSLPASCVPVFGNLVTLVCCIS